MPTESERKLRKFMLVYEFSREVRPGVSALGNGRSFGEGYVLSQEQIEQWESEIRDALFELYSVKSLGISNIIELEG